MPETTRILPFDDEAIAEAARLIAEGQPVAVPTETVYGLAADATNAQAVARIYEAKGRPSFNPLIVHVFDLAAAERIGVFSADAHKLAEEHWPGPLTLVVPVRNDAGIAALVTAGLPTIAIRVPAHPVMRALLTAVERPLAAPSANSSGSISPTRAQHVMKSLSGRIPLIVDAGPTETGIESTILAATGDHLRLLRKGPIEFDVPMEVGNNSIEAPGQLASHYAPLKPLRLNAEICADDEFLIGFGAVEGDSNISPTGNLTEAASRLFHSLHEADESGKAKIAIAPIPENGVGGAINDRLRRAASKD